MVTINCSVYEQGRFLKVLEKSKEYRNRDFKEGKITKAELEYDIDRINELIDRVNGIYTHDYLLNSSLYREKNSTKKNKDEDLKIQLL